MTRLLFLLFGLLLSSSSLAAIDDYVVKQWNIQSGLPSQSVKSVVQDEQGYIWLGTQFGLSRFDGHQFQNFNTQNTDFLNSNAINKLLVDRFGMLWIGTRRGLLRLDPQTMVAQRFDLQGPVRDILADEDGGIWVAANGLYYVSAKKLTLAANNIEQSNLSVTQINQIVGSVTKMALVPDGIWLVNERHLLKISESSNRSGDGVRLELASKVSLPEQLAQTIVHDLAWVDGKLFLASELGAYFLDFDEVLRRYQEVGNNAVYKFLNDKEGGLWVSTYGRLLYRQSNGIWQSVEPIQLDQSIWFADIFMDDDSNIWLASLNEGLWLAHAGKVERHHIGQRSAKPFQPLRKAQMATFGLPAEKGLGSSAPERAISQCSAVYSSTAR